MSIPAVSYIILFVKDPIISGQFYKKILDLDPVETSPTFVMFALPNGLMLGLWSQATAHPTVTGTPGSSEVAFSENDVDGLHQKWVHMGITIAQAPVDMEGGRSFVALDPDGHRIRIIRPHEEQS